MQVNNNSRINKAFYLSLLLITFSIQAQATEITNYFKINQVFVSTSENMHFRIYGFGAITNCTDGATWAYINESDSGSKGKIATLLSAYTAKKQVLLHLAPTDFYGNGKIYCRIVELAVKD